MADQWLPRKRQSSHMPEICQISVPLIGLLCSVLAIYFAIIGQFHGAMIGMIWAVFFDWSDGILARRHERANERSRTLWSPT